MTVICFNRSDTLLDDYEGYASVNLDEESAVQDWRKMRLCFMILRCRVPKFQGITQLLDYLPLNFARRTTSIQRLSNMAAASLLGAKTPTGARWIPMFSTIDR